MSLVNIPIKKRVAEYQVTLAGSGSGGSYVKGIWVPSISGTVTKSLAIFKLDFKALQAMPEGMYTTEDVKIYEVGSATIPLHSTVVFEGKVYEFDMEADRDKDGQFSMYIAKKKEEPNDTP